MRVILTIECGFECRSGGVILFGVDRDGLQSFLALHAPALLVSVCAD
jgi:hypothetical protein